MWINEDDDDDSGARRSMKEIERGRESGRKTRIQNNCEEKETKIEKRRKNLIRLDCRLAVSRGRDEGKFAENPGESCNKEENRETEKGRKRERERERKRESEERRKEDFKMLKEGSTTYYLVA